MPAEKYMIYLAPTLCVLGVDATNLCRKIESSQESHWPMQWSMRSSQLLLQTIVDSDFCTFKTVLMTLSHADFITRTSSLTPLQKTFFWIAKISLYLLHALALSLSLLYKIAKEWFGRLPIKTLSTQWSRRFTNKTSGTGPQSTVRLTAPSDGQLMNYRVESVVRRYWQYADIQKTQKPFGSAGGISTLFVPVGHPCATAGMKTQLAVLNINRNKSRLRGPRLN